MIAPMRGVIILLILVLCIGGGAIWWFLIRVTPEDAFLRAMQQIPQTTSVQQIQGTLFWDRISPTGQGFALENWLSFAGSADISDPTHPLVSGVAGISKTASTKDLDTLDVVLTKTDIAFKLKEAHEGMRFWAAWATSTTDPMQTWIKLSRDTVLEKQAFNAWISTAKPEVVRTAINAASIAQWGKPVSQRVVTAQGRSVIEQQVKLDARTIENGLVTMLTAWNGRNLNADELDWAHRSAIGAAQWTWAVTIDQRTYHLIGIQGSWALVDNSNHDTGHVTLSLSIGSYGGTVAVTIPSNAVDSTEKIFPSSAPTFLPSTERETPVPATTSTSNENQYNVSQDYLDALGKKRKR